MFSVIKSDVCNVRHYLHSCAHFLHLLDKSAPSSRFEVSGEKEGGEGNDPSLWVNCKQPNDTWQYKMEKSNKHERACLEALLVQ